MELKLVKDKLMAGNFTVVDIYLEGLKPRLEKQWQTLGKKPKKKEIELIELKEIEASIASAQKDRKDWEKTQVPASNQQEQNTQKENNETKIVKPLTFDNGIMVSSLKEFKETLPTLDESVMKAAITDNKNQIADWVESQIDPLLGKSLKSTKTKAEIQKILDNFGKESTKDEKKDEKKENSKTEEKNKEDTPSKEGSTQQKEEKEKIKETPKDEKKETKVLDKKNKTEK